MDQPEEFRWDGRRWALSAMPRKVSFGVVAVGCALAIVACGASGTSRSATDSSGHALGVAYADCMRSHGVPNFPDASAGGGFDIPSTINAQSPAYSMYHCVRPRSYGRKIESIMSRTAK
jgi:hypothetical protein